jgi:hypothetical protein
VQHRLVAAADDAGEVEARPGGRPGDQAARRLRHRGPGGGEVGAQHLRLPPRLVGSLLAAHRLLLPGGLGGLLLAGGLVAPRRLLPRPPLQLRLGVDGRGCPGGGGLWGDGRRRRGCLGDACLLPRILLRGEAKLLQPLLLRLAAVAPAAEEEEGRDPRRGECSRPPAISPTGALRAGAGGGEAGDAAAGRGTGAAGATVPTSVASLSSPGSRPASAKPPGAEAGAVEAARIAAAKAAAFG